MELPSASPDMRRVNATLQSTTIASRWRNGAASPWVMLAHRNDEYPTEENVAPVAPGGVAARGRR